MHHTSMLNLSAQATVLNNILIAMHAVKPIITFLVLISTLAARNKNLSSLVHIITTPVGTIQAVSYHI